MQNLSVRVISSLLLACLWANSATAQRPAQPSLSAESELPTASARTTAVAPTPALKCRLKVRSPQRRGARRFPATKILDLDFHVTFRRLPAEARLVRIEVETPRGHLFQVLTVPFSDDPSESDTRRAVEGFSRPLEVQPTSTDRGRGGTLFKRVSARLPVAGTPIVHSSLYGRWTARAFVGDDVESCGRVRAFVITP